MNALMQNSFFERRHKIPAKDVRLFVHRLMKATGAREKTLAQSVAMAESQFNRLASSKAGSYKTQTLLPLKRIATLVDEARQTLSEEGVKHWLGAPNPYLNDVPPILCLRTDKELEKVLTLLASIRYGFPA